MKLLLALDGTAIARETTAAVQRMFTPTATSVVVLSVMGSNEPAAVPSPVLLSAAAQSLALIEADRVRAHEEVVATAARSLRSAGFEVSEEIRQGDPRQAIVAAAQTHAVDLVVVGSHGRSAAERLMLGSVATHVTQHAPCDVLVVRHPRGT